LSLTARPDRPAVDLAGARRCGFRAERQRRPRAAVELRQAGQGIVEYGLILAIMIVVCVVALVFFGDQLAAILGFIASKV
jgi:Flp pilus assembly pilin Flp